MTRTKSPFPTFATPGMEQVAEVRGMEVHRTSSPRWTDYLVRDRHDPTVFARAEVFVATLANSVDLGGRGPRYNRWVVQVEAQDRDPNLEDATTYQNAWASPTRRQAELSALRGLVTAVRVVSGEVANQTETPATLLGLEARQMVRRAAAQGRRDREYIAGRTGEYGRRTSR